MHAKSRYIQELRHASADCIARSHARKPDQRRVECKPHSMRFPKEFLFPQNGAQQCSKKFIKTLPPVIALIDSSILHRAPHVGLDHILQTDPWN